MRLILQMIDVDEKVRTKQKSKYKRSVENIAKLRAKREKILIKKHDLSLQAKHSNKMTYVGCKGVLNNLERLSKELEILNSKIERHQKHVNRNNDIIDI